MALVLHGDQAAVALGEKLLVILLLAVLAIQLLPGCAPSPERSRLEQIETIIDEHPDSAMILIDSVDTAALRSDRDRALYGMLLTEALDKTIRTHQTTP